jgi:hypothetical protein
MSIPAEAPPLLVLLLERIELGLQLGGALDLAICKILSFRKDFVVFLDGWQLRAGFKWGG